MKQWYYRHEDQQRGPVSEADIAHLCETGRLSTDTLVWNQEIKQWTAARDVDGLLPPTCLTPPPAIQPVVKTKHIPSGNQIRPWVRYWARTVDFYLFCIFVSMVLALVYAPALAMPNVLFGIILMFAYVFVEPAMLMSWGTTPGKALLKVQLRNDDGTKLSYTDALRRTFKVWFRGEGLSIPIVTLFTHIKAYDRLSKQLITSWDEEGGFKVTHQPVGASRIVLVVLIMLAVCVLVAIGNAGI